MLVNPDSVELSLKRKRESRDQTSSVIFSQLCDKFLLRIYLWIYWISYDRDCDHLFAYNERFIREEMIKTSSSVLLVAADQQFSDLREETNLSDARFRPSKMQTEAARLSKAR